MQRLVVTPLNNALSRWREPLADRYALESTHNPHAFADALTRLANQNLAEADPEPWVVFFFYSHPPIRERVAAAQNFKGVRCHKITLCVAQAKTPAPPPMI